MSSLGRHFKPTCYLPERLARAWQETPTKWYPLPVAAGALLLLIMQWRKRVTDNKEVHVDEHGREVVKLKGPWQVCDNASSYDGSMKLIMCRSMSLVHSPSGTCPDYGDT